MSALQKPEKERRCRLVKTFVKPAEKRRIERDAEEAGRSVSDYVRRKLLGMTV